MRVIQRVKRVKRVHTDLKGDERIKRIYFKSTNKYLSIMDDVDAVIAAAKAKGLTLPQKTALELVKIQALRSIADRLPHIPE